MKIVYVVGNRPQFVKLAPLHQAFKKAASVKETIIHTGQHFSHNMSGVFFEELGIDLPVIQLTQLPMHHAAMIGSMMVHLHEALKKLQPDWVLVFGDTNTTLAGALTAKKMNIRCAHVEAGIRTGDEEMPEESNRYLTDRLADVNFCCTALNRQNMMEEGFGSAIKSTILLSGDLMQDAHLLFKERYRNINFSITGLDLHQPFTVLTLHRKKNVEDPVTLRNIINAINLINDHLPVVFAVHPNTQQLMHNANITTTAITTAPLPYFEMQHLLHHSQFVITDSGGLQREAFFHHKPTLILMQQPFWPEVVNAGYAINCKSDTEDILACFEVLTRLQPQTYQPVFGTGEAAFNITQYFLTHAG